jgi:4-nitrophenyl phosphatase
MAFAVRPLYGGTMLSHLPASIKGLIIDMDGVLWKDKEAIIDLPLVFKIIRQEGLKFTLATNNSSRTPRQYQEKLRGFGVEVEINEIITSSMAAAHLLKKRFPAGGPVYLVGETGLTEGFAESGFFQSEEDPIAVVVGLDRQFTYAKLKAANQFIRKGAVFYGTNPDRTFPTPKEITPGAGSIIAAVEAACGMTPIIAGKPEPLMLQFALEKMNCLAEQTIQVGDRLDTDILGGFRAGCKTALVLSGISTQADLAEWEPKPDFVFPDFQSMFV